MLQPAADKANAYGRQIVAITTETKNEFEKLLAETTADAQNLFTTMVDTAARNAPAGSENGIALWKSAVATANGGYEVLQKAAQQATDLAGANYTAVSASVAEATPATAKSRRG